MIAVAIIPLLLTAAASTVSPEATAAVAQDQAVRVHLDESGEYYPGHDAQVDVRTEHDGYLLVLQVDPQGRLRVLFPLEPFDDAFVEGGKKYELVDRGGRGTFYVGDVDGIGTVFAAHSDWPFHVNAFSRNQRWDYESLRIDPEADVETALVDLVAKITYDGWFEYDLVEYEVYSGGSYADGGVGYTIYTEPYSICCTTSVGASIYIGTGYYPWGYPWYFSSYAYYPSYHYYGPYYGPYYYRPYYVYRPRYRYPYYGGRYAAGYRPGRDYRFKSPHRYDRDRSSDPYRPRVGVDAGRHGLGGGAVDYRRRRSPITTASSPRRRRDATATTARGNVPRQARPSGRVRSGAGGYSPQGRNRAGAAGGRSRTGVAGDRPRRREATSGRRTTRPTPSRTTRRATPQPGRAAEPRAGTSRPRSRTASEPRVRTRSLGRPQLKRSQPKGGRSARGKASKRPRRTAGGTGSSRPKASRPSSPPSRRARRPSAPTRRPQARAGGSTRRATGARAPSRSRARSGGSRRRP